MEKMEYANSFKVTMNGDTGEADIFFEQTSPFTLPEKSSMGNPQNVSVVNIAMPIVVAKNLAEVINNCISQIEQQISKKGQGDGE